MPVVATPRESSTIGDEIHMECTSNIENRASARHPSRATFPRVQFRITGLTWLLLVGAALCSSTWILVAGEVKMTYPTTRRVSHTDDYHGTKVEDPYRWLEDDARESADVAQWVAEQNKVTFAYLEKLPQRQALRDRLTELWNYERYSNPFKVGGRYFFYKNDGLQNQAVLYVQDTLTSPAKVVLDPNQWSKDGTVAIARASMSDDGRYLAYSVADAGSDWQTWRVLDIDKGTLLPDEIKWVKFSDASWTRDNRGFFYSRFDDPGPEGKFQSLNLNQKLYYHRLGTPQDHDVLVYKRPDHPEWTIQGSVTEDGRWLVITMQVGTDDRYRVTIKDLDEPFAMPLDLIENFDYEYSLVGNDGPVLYFKTDRDAPRGRVIAIDLRRPAVENWREIIPQSPDNLQGVSLVGNQFVATYLKDARTQVKMFAPDGMFIREVEFPTLGAASGFGGRRTDTETFYSFSSFATPPSVYRYDLLTGKSTLLRQAPVKFNPDEYTVEQVFFPSKDGTKIPMFLSYKKGMRQNGNNPTLLYGYGGFNIPLTPGFSVSRLAWMEQGGIYAQVNLRGGGEYGRDWHKAGTKLKKQNVFDDCISAAEWLIAQKYTKAEKLAVQGGSNGGLLVGAVMTQRPDLFGACLPAVGVMDMLRFHKFTAGRFWVDDYGSADNPEEFQALRAYSPYHNLKPGVRYPATLVTTADTDDRVVPGHSFKFAAQLQYSHVGSNPVLIRIETRAGHGAGTPTSKLIEKTADEWAFLLQSLNATNP